ncbi:MAG: PCRF domain-containing protein [Desulfococcaceae bacterium]
MAHAQRPRPQKSRSGPAFVGLLVFLALLLGGGRLWDTWRSSHSPPIPDQPPAPPPAEAPVPGPPPVATAPPRRPVLRYEADNERFQELMERRKAEVGLRDSVDMIVRENETLRIGDNTVSMSEILADIRLESGEVLEESLDGSAASPALRAARLERLHDRLRAAEQEFWSLERALTDPEADPETLAELARRQKELAGTVSDFQRYRETLESLDALRAILAKPDPSAAAAARAENLRTRRAETTERLRKVLADLGEPVPRAGDADALREAMERLERRFWETESRLRSDAAPVNPDELRALAAERARLRDAVAAFQEYQTLERRIGDLESLPEPAAAPRLLEERAAELAERRDELEGRLMADVLSDEPSPLFGIYVVRPGDNIWNIHFRFLREYFGRRDVRLAPVADEPDERGISSGVGKILKFSETMVHIYNLRERRLDTNLNLIHPDSKVVVFNLSEAFDLLGRIDEENIRELRFDGETLWIPAG